MIPFPTVNPKISSNPFPATPSTSNNAHQPTMLAREFIRSALSTKPNVAGVISGTIGGGGTPGGDARFALSRSASTALLSAIAFWMPSNGPACTRTARCAGRDAREGVRDDVGDSFGANAARELEANIVGDARERVRTTGVGDVDDVIDVIEV